MSRYDTRPSFEFTVARLHLTAYIENLGPRPTGTIILVLPETTDAESWLQPAIQLIREMRNGKGLQEIDVDAVPDCGGPTQVSFDAALLTNNGLAYGHTGARCMIYLTEHDHDDLKQPSIRLADALEYLDLEPVLVVQAAAEHGRTISLYDAEMLTAMPSRHRRLALSASRPIAESFEIIDLVVEQELKLAAEEKADAKAKNKKSSLPVRSVPSGVSLDDLHGYGGAKTWGLEVARDIRDFVHGNIRWEDVDGGILLSGPPGCGKTSFARALAVSAECHFVSGSYAQWQSAGHQGDMLAAMRTAFEEAARCAPSILLIDEIDGFMDRERDRHNSDYIRGVVNGLLELLDGAFDRSGVVVIGATNNPDVVDPAVRRAGRLDRHVRIGLPDADARLEILRQHLGVAEDFGLKAFTRHTEGMSGADLERIARDARRLARRERTELRHTHVARALPRRESRTPSELRLIAAHEMGHAVVAAALGGQVAKVAIMKDRDPEATAGVAGYAAVMPRGGPHDIDWYLDRIAHVLGGLAAERMLYGSHSEGVVLDLAEASNLATYALTSLGMGDTLLSDGHRDPAALVSARANDPVLRQRIDDILRDQADRAVEILAEHRTAFDQLVEVLIIHGEIDGAVVADTMTSCAAPAPAQLSLAV